ncbi:uncharacterized protein [Triticum aestivum]|uniref:uncharacterized protein isoform X3 n=1 Tax=Triticum aestivum TaxID=4565 RepID=UPI001D030248|nr:uncharacterized protein LOC123190846 isoform X3 [Triticum aestivum]
MELAVWRFVFYSPPFKGVKGKHPVGVVCSSDHLEQHHIIKVPNNSAALLPSGEAMSTRTNSMYGDSMEQVEFVEQVMDDAMEDSKDIWMIIMVRGKYIAMMMMFRFMMIMMFRSMMMMMDAISFS